MQRQAEALHAITIKCLQCGGRVGGRRVGGVRDRAWVWGAVAAGSAAAAELGELAGLS